MEAARAARPRHGALLIVGMVVVAANLRPAASSVGPTLDQIRDGLDLSSTAASALVGLPLVCFGALALLAPMLAARLGYANTVALAMTGLVCGLALRITDGVPALFAGTLLAGASIATGNVLLPVLVKRSFPGRPGFATALYSTALIGFASLAAGLTLPIEDALGGGWRLGLGVWAVTAALALLVWLPQLRTREPGETGGVHLRGALRLAREPVARHLTLFFGLQSASFYAMLSWLPTLLKAEGVGSTSAGALLGVSMIMGLPCALVVPHLAERATDQRRLAVAFCAVTAVGFAGLMVAPGSVPLLWAVLIGVGQGACFPLALTMIVLRSGSVGATAGLSTLVQAFGYLIAALGPLAVGVVHDLSGSWTPAVGLLLALLLPQALVGAAAGRNLQVTEEPA
jgi:CP family cyanate transporter-like MFS transporter